MEKAEFVPYLSVCSGPKAVRYYSTVFNVEPRILLEMQDGRIMHCEFKIGDNRFFISDELTEHGGTPNPISLGGTSIAIHLYVEDCDGMVDRMVSAGGQLLSAPENMFWGERFARVRDPFGHEWGITTELCEMTQEEILKAINNIKNK